MKRTKISGFQQRKIKKAKDLATKACSGDIYKYVTPVASTSSAEIEPSSSLEKPTPSSSLEEIELHNTDGNAEGFDRDKEHDISVREKEDFGE